MTAAQAYEAAGFHREGNGMVRSTDPSEPDLSAYLFVTCWDGSDTPQDLDEEILVGFYDAGCGDSIKIRFPSSHVFLASLVRD